MFYPASITNEPPRHNFTLTSWWSWLLSGEARKREREKNQTEKRVKCRAQYETGEVIQQRQHGEAERQVLNVEKTLGMNCYGPHWDYCAELNRHYMQPGADVLVIILTFRGAVYGREKGEIPHPVISLMVDVCVYIFYVCVLYGSLLLLCFSAARIFYMLATLFICIWYDGGSMSSWAWFSSH